MKRILGQPLRTARKAPGGQVDHTLNCAVGRMRLLRSDHDFGAFRRVTVEAHRHRPLRILAWFKVGVRPVNTVLDG